VGHTALKKSGCFRMRLRVYCPAATAAAAGQQTRVAHMAAGAMIVSDADDFDFERSVQFKTTFLVIIRNNDFMAKICFRGALLWTG
jgi:hypothetical protein